MRVQSIGSSCLEPPGTTEFRKTPLKVAATRPDLTTETLSKEHASSDVLKVFKVIGSVLRKLGRAIRNDMARSAEIHNRMMSHYDQRHSHNGYYIR